MTNREKASKIDSTILKLNKFIGMMDKNDIDISDSQLVCEIHESLKLGYDAVNELERKEKK